MSEATKRKHVIKELYDSFQLPKSDQKVVQVLESRGNNLHFVRDKDDNKFLVSMPTKFRRNIWIKRNDLVLIEPIEEGDKVKGEIVKIFNIKGHVRYLIEEGYWFKNGKTIRTYENSDQNFDELKTNGNNIHSEEENSDFELDHLPKNTNRPPNYEESTSESENES